MTTLVMHCNVHRAAKDVVGERSDIQFRVTTPSGRSYSGTSRTKVDLSSSDEEVFVEKGSCLPTSNCGKGDDQRRHLNVNNRVSDFFRHKPKRSERSEHSHCHDQHSLDSSYFSKPSNRNSGFSVNSFMEDTALRDFGGGNHPQCHDVTVTSRFLQPT
uniref:Uncharacterized protein n=1 Tax=Ciona savignyi TaxID=51511 RepID=H2ZFT7_CIOSA